MLCNVYVKEANSELRRIGINSSTPVFFINLSQQVITKLKSMEVKGQLETYLVQEDPYLKDLSNKWINGGVQLPEIRIVEKIVQTPPTIIEKTIEIPVEVEVIREVIKEVVREVEVIKEVIKEVPAVINETATITDESVKVVEVEEQDEEEGFLIDTKVAFEDWKTKNVKPAKIEEKLVSTYTDEEKMSDPFGLDLPKEVVDPLVEDTTMPILVSEEDVSPKIVDEPVEIKMVKRGRKKKETTEAVEIPTEFIVELTAEEKELYKDLEVVEEE